MSRKIKISVELELHEAKTLHDVLRRMGFRDFREHTTDNSDAYSALHGAQAIIDELKAKGL